MGKRKRNSLVVRIVAFGPLNPLSKFNDAIEEVGGILVEISSLDKMYQGRNTHQVFYRIKGTLIENYPKIPNGSRGIKQLKAGDPIDEKYADIKVLDAKKKR